MRAAAMPLGLQRRLWLLLLVPLTLLAGVNAWFDYRVADDTAALQDRQLLKLLPLLADSVIARGATRADPPVMLMAPVVQEFLKEQGSLSAYGVATPDGEILAGDAWLRPAWRVSTEPEFSTEQVGGVTYRIVSQRVSTVAGELVLRLADGSDPRQQWVKLLIYKVVLPNLALLMIVALGANWAVRRALRPLLELKNAVERRSPRDLTALDADASPEEVRPLVESINRLFQLVNAQTEVQRRFIADAAHQLRTPLAGLQSQTEAWAQVVNQPVKSSSNGLDYAVKPAVSNMQYDNNAIVLRPDQINKLRDAARRTTQLANQLLALSRADASRFDRQPLDRVDLRDLCETLLEVYLDAAAVKRIDLGIEAQAAHVTGHGWLLRELLSNLLDNALKYTPEGGTVTLRCARTPGSGVPFLEVEDNGPGIAVDERSRVFGRFYRVPGSSVEGNGLGLAIADEIARVHQSQLSIASGPGGGGTRITMLFAV